MIREILKSIAKQDLIRPVWAALAASIAFGFAVPARAANKGPDAASYTATDSTVYTFVDLVAGGGSASVLSGTDDGVALLTLPFPFQFYGNSYTMACASVNGVLYFVTSQQQCTGLTDFANTDISSTSMPGNLPAAMPLWSDLTFQTAGAGSVFYQSQGNPGSRKFIVEWQNAYPQGSSNAVTFEAILSEGTNQILFQYQTVNLGSGNPATLGALASVGIRDASGNSNNREIAWSYEAPVLGNGTAILFAPPSSAQTSVNTITSSPVGLTVLIDGIGYVTPKTVSWTPGSPHTLSANSPQTAAGVQNTFTAWSPGGATPQINVQALATGTTYTASFSTQYQLTTGTNPANVGSVSGAGWYASNSLATVQATAPSGYAFDHFSGDLTGTVNPINLTMSAPKNVVANFRVSGNPVLTAAVSGKADGSVAGQRVWTIRLSNTGSGIAAGTQITAAALTQLAGTPCSPQASIISNLPVMVGDIAPAGSGTGQISLNFAGCADTTTGRFSLKVTFAADSGLYSGSTTISNQTK